MNNFKEVYKERRTRKFIPDINGQYVNILYGVDNSSHWVDIALLKESTYKDKNRYRKNNDNIIDTNIVGTALAFVTTLFLIIFCSTILWSWFKGRITDGYWMILLSPFIIINWILATILYIPLFVIFTALFIVAILWTLIIEAPAAYMNGEEVNPFYVTDSDSVYEDGSD